MHFVLVISKNVQFCLFCSFTGDFQPEDSLDGQVSGNISLKLFLFNYN